MQDKKECQSLEYFISNTLCNLIFCLQKGHFKKAVAVMVLRKLFLVANSISMGQKNKNKLGLRWAKLSSS